MLNTKDYAIIGCEVNMKKVFVCASMGLAKNENINLQARKLGEILGLNKDVIYVQGGSPYGLMGETLKEFIKHSNNVEFYIPDSYYEEDSIALIELLGVENFNATKTRGEAGRLESVIKCDHIIVLPGGTGTLEELLYSNETSRAKEHQSKITIVNIDGYYNGFLQQVQTNIEQGLSKTSTVRYEVVENVNQIQF